MFKNPFKRKKKIMIIEDDTNTAILLSNVLTLEGFETATARDGVEGIEMVQQNPPDLIILDIMLPKMDGTKVLLLLKSKPKTKDIPVLMCSVLNRLNDVEDCANS